MEKPSPKVKAEKLQTLDVIKFNNFISVIKSLNVESVDICNSVLFYGNETVFIEADLTGLFGANIIGKFPLGEESLKTLSDVILSDEGQIQILQGKQDSIIIKKDGSEHEYHLEKVEETKSIPDDVKSSIDVSDILTATDHDLNKFHALYAAKELFVLQDKKRFCVTDSEQFIFDESCKTGQSYSFDYFITYLAEEAEFRIKEQSDGTSTFWLNMNYRQNGILVSVYSRLSSKNVSLKSKAPPQLNPSDLTLLGHITPHNFDLFGKYLSFFSKFSEVIIHQGKTYAELNSKLIAYCDSSDFFSAKIDFRIKDPGKFKKEYARLDDNAGSTLPFDLKARNKILIARHKNGNVIFIKIPPNIQVPQTLKDYLSGDYAFAEFDPSSQPNVFANINLNIGNGTYIDPKKVETICSPVYYELTAAKIEKIKKDVILEKFPDDGLIKPDKQKFFDELVDAVDSISGNYYETPDQFSEAYDNATRDMITAIVGDEYGEPIHARKKDFESRQKHEPRFEVITQNDINLYRQKIADKAKEEAKPSGFQLYSEKDRLKFCVGKGRGDRTHFLAEDNSWDCLYESKHFLAFEASSYECSISHQNNDFWLVTKHRFFQKDILTFEKVDKKAEQKGIQITKIDPNCNISTIPPLDSITVIEKRIISNYKQYLDYRFEMLKDFCHILKYKQYYFKDSNEQTAFFEQLRDKLQIAQSTLFADRRIAEMLISLDKEDLLDNYEKGRSYKLMRIASAYDDKTKKTLLKGIDKYSRDDIDTYIAQSKPQSNRAKDNESKIRGMKIKKQRHRIVLSFDRKWNENKTQFDEKVEKIYKVIANLEKADLDKA